MEGRQAFNKNDQKLEGNGIYFRDWGITVDLSYSDMFYSRPSYTYKIEFFEDNKESAVWNNTSSCHDDCQVYTTESECNAATSYGCGWTEEKSGSGSKCFFMTPIPFKITNLTTQKEVSVYLTDNGVNETREEEDGAGDCVWERSEAIAFKLDTTNIRLKADGSCHHRRRGCPGL